MITFLFFHYYRSQQPFVCPASSHHHRFPPLFAPMTHKNTVIDAIASLLSQLLLYLNLQLTRMVRRKFKATQEATVKGAHNGATPECQP
jgi:hypothetical protein